MFLLGTSAVMMSPGQKRTSTEFLESSPRNVVHSQEYRAFELQAKCADAIPRVLDVNARRGFEENLHDSSGAGRTERIKKNENIIISYYRKSYVKSMGGRGWWQTYLDVSNTDLDTVSAADSGWIRLYSVRGALICTSFSARARAVAPNYF